MKEEYPMLLATVNNSIGDRNKHMKINELIKLFDVQEELTNIQKYAIDMIQTEATDQEINFFVNKYNIFQEKLNHILSIKPYK